MSTTATRVDASETDVTEPVTYLCRTLGQVVTAAIAGVDDARLVESWSRGSSVELPDSRRSLLAAYRVATLLDEAVSPQTVRAWFMGSNPDLDDRSPVEVLRDDPYRALQAADDFLAHG